MGRISLRLYVALRGVQVGEGVGRLLRYQQRVAIWLGGDKFGKRQLCGGSRLVENLDRYSRSFSSMGAIVSQRHQSTPAA